ncbi:hypothetical protein [Paraburkholderia ribeironis]|uniref:hypothetical protein n=1 Tax=Paraburkholderia ribeironis TaxID=1247936 RepID=UPI00135634B9|nr:hypothetical protein [Paraburkholderia ribeironis]
MASRELRFIPAASSARLSMCAVTATVRFALVVADFRLTGYLIGDTLERQRLPVWRADL